MTVTIGTVDNGFYIEDNGPGIPHEDHDAIFDLGHSTTKDGTGLGLYIVEQIVEAHDWQITVTEGTAGGARFMISGVKFDKH